MCGGKPHGRCSLVSITMTMLHALLSTGSSAHRAFRERTDRRPAASPDGSEAVSAPRKSAEDMLAARRSASTAPELVRWMLDSAAAVAPDTRPVRSGAAARSAAVADIL